MERKDFHIALIVPFGLDFGVRHISSFLKSKGYVTSLIEFQQLTMPRALMVSDYFANPKLNIKLAPPKDLRNLVAVLKQMKPDLIGISVSSVAFQAAQIITKELRRHFNVPIVWGGIHAILCPEECIEHVDYVCPGEGEYPMFELAEQLRQGKKPSGIESLWIKRDAEEIEKNELRALIDPLDSLPFPDYVDQTNKFMLQGGKVIEGPPTHSFVFATYYPIMTSRGCMYTCSFCCNTVIRKQYEGKGSYLRRRSPGNVIEELKLAVQNRFITGIEFWDDVFTFDKEWIEEFCQRYVEEVGKEFFCYAHPRYTDKNIAMKLCDVGLNIVTVGIQSGSERVSKALMNRDQDNQAIIDFAKLLQSRLVLASFDLITENPYESDEDEDATLDVLLRLPHPYTIQIYSLSFFPKTPLTKKLIEDGYLRPQDQEQYTSKCVNNFFMFIQISKNKRNLYWNSLKAFAVHRFFPKRMVRFLRRRKFLRRFPILLYLFGIIWSYTVRFIRFGIFFEKENVLSMVTSNTPEHIPFDTYIWQPSTKDFSLPIDMWFHCFPNGVNNGNKKFGFKIHNRRNKKKKRSFYIDVHPYRHPNVINLTRWEVEFDIDPGLNEQIDFELSFPDLFVTYRGKTSKAKIVHEYPQAPEKDKLYFFRVLYCMPYIEGANWLVGYAIFKG